MNIEKYRQAEYEIDSLFLERWSPRSFSDKQVDEKTLWSLFEAARWSPSAMNSQPWRFIVARKKEELEKFNSFILEGNRIWCEKAPVLALIISDKEAGANHAFDTGAAWLALALQAKMKGLITHPMSGINKEKARDVLHIPEQFEIQALVAIGYQDVREKLAPALQEREQPSPRRPIAESIIEGSFKE
ncbi:nitroreductase [Gracilibacillus halotolerans]|uniref:Nitroreductase n=1 Tax=Gracilibacillus halotolerans TaxID=74386 RepID=A0A841RIK1_9BACI|nr:nitroreductase family protein [Gracilibacillus halotolerans]MBB6514040.1 nitroreductase [Gracilibacillus halotolerans]